MTSSGAIMNSLTNQNLKDSSRCSRAENGVTKQPQQRKLTAVKKTKSSSYKTVDLTEFKHTETPVEVNVTPVNFDLQDHVERLKYLLRENYDDHRQIFEQMTTSPELDNPRVVATSLILIGERLLAALSVQRLNVGKPSRVELTLAVAKDWQQHGDFLPAIRRLLRELALRQGWEEVRLCEHGEPRLLKSLLPV
jgi:hypothetical protein